MHFHESAINSRKFLRFKVFHCVMVALVVMVVLLVDFVLCVCALYFIYLIFSMSRARFWAYTPVQTKGQSNFSQVLAAP